MKKLTVGSLFSGIGGLDLGLEQTGRFQVKWQVEIDPYCERVLSLRWPHVAKHNDVHLVGKHNAAAVDLICGGFPCQDISNAGRKAGIDGKRSGLWSEYYRIICELRPRYVLVENVSALLQRGMERVLGDLASCGYDAEWQCLPAAAFGAPHIRDRVFILAYPTGSQREQVLRTPNRQQDCSTLMGWTKKEWCTDWESFDVASRHCLMGLWVPQSNVQRVLDGVPSRMDRLRALGNSVVPQVAQFAGECIIAVEDYQTATVQEGGAA